MATLTNDEVQALQEMAEQNDGHCATCQRVIQIYRYHINKQMATVLKLMRDAVEKNGANEVNFDQLDIPYRLGSQRTKMRLHGLIAKVRDDEGRHIQNTWLITKKGGDFLAGVTIPKTVVVFDNQVIGHEGDLVSIHTVMEDAAFQRSPISSDEAEVYSQAKKPHHMTMTATYVGGLQAFLEQGKDYELHIGRLQVGKPVKVSYPGPGMSRVEIEYQDIARFQRNWKVKK